MITCYVGLHHFPEDQLDQFLEQVRRILRPGGRFLLVDHDAHNDESLIMANMAHTIFNAVNGISVHEEMTETRNFRPMSYWKELLSKHDLGQDDSGPELAMVRQGDPCLNTLVSFVKPGPRPFAGLGLRVGNENEAGKEPLHASRGLSVFEPARQPEPAPQASPEVVARL